jgi:hypothetical protein
VTQNNCNGLISVALFVEMFGRNLNPEHIKSCWYATLK